NVAALTQSLQQDVPQITASTRVMLDKLDPLADEAVETVRKLRAAATGVQTMTGELRESTPPGVARIDSFTQSADASMLGVRELLADKDPALRQTVDNMQAITQQVREQHLVQFAAALETANQALANVRTTTEELSAFVVGQR